MKNVAVWSHKDGDYLVISERPWFRVAVDHVVGRYQPYWGWDYILCNAILNWSYGKTKELVKLPVAHSCEISDQIWGTEGGLDTCWHKYETPDDIRLVTMTHLEWLESVNRGLKRLNLTYGQLALQAAEDNFISMEARKLWRVIGTRGRKDVTKNEEGAV